MKKWNKVGIRVSDLRNRMREFHKEFPDYKTKSFTFDKEFLLSILERPDCAGLRIIPIMGRDGRPTLHAVGVDAQNSDMLERIQIHVMGFAMLPSQPPDDDGSNDYEPAPCPNLCGKGIVE